MSNSKFVTEISHNHAEGIKGAQATASLIVLSRKEKDKEKLRQYIEKEFGYDLSRSVDELREVYEYNETCQEKYLVSIMPIRYNIGYMIVDVQNQDI